MKRREFTFICEVPKGTQLVSVGDRVLVLRPNMAPAVITAGRLEPLSFTNTFADPLPPGRNARGR